jgi:hypothetical protein
MPLTTGLMMVEKYGKDLTPRTGVNYRMLK